MQVKFFWVVEGRSEKTGKFVFFFFFLVKSEKSRKSVLRNSVLTCIDDIDINISSVNSICIAKKNGNIPKKNKKKQ